MRSSTLVLLIALLCATVASAQQTTGTITGRATDAQNLAVPGATVTLTGPQGTQNATTDGQGRFTFPYVTPGTYTIRVELTGFNGISLACKLGKMLRPATELVATPVILLTITRNPPDWFVVTL